MNDVMLPEAPESPPEGWESWEALMRLAMQEAEAAEAAGEVPVGALLVGMNGTVLARAANGPIGAHDPTAHAEMTALRRACESQANYRLPPDTVCVVTLEPCLMCVGALIHARVAGVVYGAPDPKTGAVASCLPGPALPFLNHRFWTVAGVLADECGDQLRRFFRAKRGK